MSWINVSVMPIPADVELSVRYQMQIAEQAVQLEVLTALGQQVYSETLRTQEGERSIPVANWPEGIYYLRLSGSKNMEVHKIKVLH